MNTKNNKKYQETEKKICKTFLHLLTQKKLSDISITEICRAADITRATFYAHSSDVLGLMAKSDEMLSQDLVASLWEYNSQHEGAWDINVCFTQLFEHVRENRHFYRIYISHVPVLPLFEALPDAYLRLSGTDILRTKELDETLQRRLQFHNAFFYAGMTAFLRVWLEGDCRESVEEMLSLISEQYHPKQSALLNRKKHGTD